MVNLYKQMKVLLEQVDKTSKYSVLEDPNTSTKTLDDHYQALNPTHRNLDLKAMNRFIAHPNSSQRVLTHIAKNFSDTERTGEDLIKHPNSDFNVLKHVINKRPDLAAKVMSHPLVQMDLLSNPDILSSTFNTDRFSALALRKAADHPDLDHATQNAMYSNPFLHDSLAKNPNLAPNLTNDMIRKYYHDKNTMSPEEFDNDEASLFNMDGIVQHNKNIPNHLINHIESQLEAGTLENPLNFLYLNKNMSPEFLHSHAQKIINKYPEYRKAGKTLVLRNALENLMDNPKLHKTTHDMIAKAYGTDNGPKFTDGSEEWED